MQNVDLSLEEEYRQNTPVRVPCPAHGVSPQPSCKACIDSYVALALQGSTITPRAAARCARTLLRFAAAALAAGYRVQHVEEIHIANGDKPIAPTAQTVAAIVDLTVGYLCGGDGSMALAKDGRGYCVAVTLNPSSDAIVMFDAQGQLDKYQTAFSAWVESTLETIAWQNL